MDSTIKHSIKSSHEDDAVFPSFFLENMGDFPSFANGEG